MKSLLLLSFVALTAAAQTPAFEVASIKPDRSIAGMSSIRLSQGRVTMENVSLKKIMLNAFGIPDDRVYLIDGPDWLATERFDIEATFPGDTPLPQVRQMMQSLLAERFKMTTHRETRLLPAYSMVVAKNGPKIHAVEDGQGRTSGGPGRLEASKITMQKLADLLARQTGVPVEDSTGLKGVFDFTLEWAPVEAPNMTMADGGSTGGSSGPSLFTALEEQLGRKLESRKSPLDVIVVDHIERSPSGN